LPRPEGPRMAVLAPHRVRDAAQPGSRDRALPLGDLPHETQRPQRVRGQPVPDAGVAHLRVQPPLLDPPCAPRTRRTVPLPLLVLPGFLQSLRNALVEPLRRHRPLDRLEVLSEQGQHPVPAVSRQQRQRGVHRGDFTQPSHIGRPLPTHRWPAWRSTTGGISVKNQGSKAGRMAAPAVWGLLMGHNNARHHRHFLFSRRACMGAGRLRCRILPVLMGLMAATVVRYRFGLFQNAYKRAQSRLPSDVPARLAPSAGRHARLRCGAVVLGGRRQLRQHSSNTAHLLKLPRSW
jgi:hypothetical protein